MRRELQITNLAHSICDLSTRLERLFSLGAHDYELHGCHYDVARTVSLYMLASGHVGAILLQPASGPCLQSWQTHFKTISCL